MKLCRKCNKSKPRQEFYANNICRSCGGRFPKQLITSIYSTQKYSSKTRGFPLPNYSLDEFRSCDYKYWWRRRGSNPCLKISDFNIYTCFLVV